MGAECAVMRAVLLQMMARGDLTMGVLSVVLFGAGCPVVWGMENSRTSEVVSGG